MTDASSCRNTESISARLARTLAWPTITPFGAEVEPDVYWMYARGDRTPPGLRQRDAFAPSMAAPSTICRSDETWAGSVRPSRLISPASVSTYFGLALLSTPVSRSASDRVRGGGNG